MSILHKLFGGPSTAQNISPQQAANPTIQAQVAASQQSTPGNMPAQPVVASDPNNPTAPATTAAPEGLDKFKDMWNLTDAEKPKAPESAFAGVTPEAIQTVAGQTDFSKVVTSEMMQAISAGGEGAVAATLQAMNAMAQNTYAQSAQASIKLIETALAKKDAEFQAALPNLIKQQTVANNLRSSNPIFSHPAAAPMLDLYQKQLQLKNPNADAADIQRQAEDLLLSFANAANPTKPSKADAKLASKADEWADWE